MTLADLTQRVRVSASGATGLLVHDDRGRNPARFVRVLWDDDNTETWSRLDLLEPVPASATIAPATRAWKQWRLRWVWITRTDDGLTIWLNIAGRRPLAHLPRWKRRLLHLPTIRVRLWPRPFRRYAHRV